MKEFLKKIVDSPMFKKVVATTVATGGSYLVLRYLVPHLLSVNVVSIAGAGAVGYIVWTKLALWEIDRIVKTVKDTAGQIGGK